MLLMLSLQQIYISLLVVWVSSPVIQPLIMLVDINLHITDGDDDGEIAYFNVR